MAKQVRVGLDEIAEDFESREDPPSDVNQKPPFVSVIVIAVVAVLAGAGGPAAIATWAADKAAFLRPHLAQPKRIAQQDVFLRVLSALRPDAFRACFFAWRVEIERNHGDARGFEVSSHRGSQHHDRRDGNSNGDRRTDRGNDLLIDLRSALATEISYGRWDIRYWTLAVPLTLLSAYLILWKPRKRIQP